MTFLEALKTGRPMRRAGWWRGDHRDRWLVLDVDGEWVWLASHHESANGPRRGDMLAEDWEVMP